MKAVRILKTQGIKAAIVDAGGDIYALGRKSKNYEDIMFYLDDIKYENGYNNFSRIIICRQDTNEGWRR